MSAVETARVMVGRETDLSWLTTDWHRAAEGASRVALVVGEAGIGKSRLVAELSRQV